MGSPTKIAIPVWQNCVSTVFDFANKLLLVEFEQQQEVGRSEISLPEESMPQRVARLKSLGPDVLICGAISRPMAYMILGSGVKVIPYVSGPVDKVLQAYMTGQLSQPQFLMPGCHPGARKGFGEGGPRCRWRGGRPR